jgi:hypothetical protein
LERESGENLEMKELFEGDVVGVFENLSHHNFSQSEVGREMFCFERSLVVKFCILSCLSDLEPDVIENMMVANELKPDDTDIQNVSTVEKNMCVEVHNVNYRECEKCNDVECNQVSDLNSFDCKFLKPEGNKYDN